MQVRSDAIHFRVKSAKRKVNGFTAFVPFTGGPNCYGQFIVDYCARCKLQPSDYFVPALIRSHGGWDLNREKPISQTSIRDGLKELITQIGLNKKEYSFHSLKRGSASTARRSGVNSHDVMALGRWKSTAMVDRYTKHTDQDLKSLSKRWF